MPATRISLPPPRIDSAWSVERVLLRRRSIRELRPEPLTLADLSQLLWAAQGITEVRGGLRTAPSAGATYPLELSVVAGKVHDLVPGVYRYLPARHTVERVLAGDIRQDLAAAALGQAWAGLGAAILIIAAVYERTTRRYGDRGTGYVHMEAGHAAQNVYLQAVALGIGTVVIGAFDDDRVQRILRLPARERPLYLLPLGRQ
jgi:SagB-type dehydrogenase family enzyme